MIVAHVKAPFVSDEPLGTRLARDCAMHETLVREVVNAHTKGQLEADVALRALAVELHSIKGVASILGCVPVATMIGSLGEVMLHRESVSRPDFWSEFASWYASLLALLQESVYGPLEHFSLEIMNTRRDELLKSLGEVRDVRAMRAAQVPRGRMSPSAGRRILLVDDSATVRVAMTARLVDRGYPVRAAKSLSETAQLLVEFDPEIVITDVRMPEVEGDELCRRIKSQMMRMVPVVLYSGMSEPELAARAKAANADAYVCKMRGVDGLIESIDALFTAAP
jgi:CheY-like chemotaxis protein